MAYLERDARLTDFVGDCGKNFDLPRREAPVVIIGVGEMRKHSLKLNVRQLRNFHGKRDGIISRDTDTPHARFKLEMNFGDLIGADGGVGNFFGKQNVVDGLRQIGGNNGVGGSVRNQSEHQNRQRESCAAELKPLVDGCDGKKIRAAFDGNPRHFNRAVPVSVRLDDGAKFACGRYVAANFRQVVSYGVEVNFGANIAKNHFEHLQSNRGGIVKFNDFMSALDGDIKNVYLLCGTETFFIDKAREKIFARLNVDRQTELVTLDCDGKPALGDVISAIDSAPFFGTRNIVLVKNEKNMGLNYTLNHCLEYADTEYCARMDGDDISLPKRFETEIEFLDSHPEYAVVSCPMIYFDEYGEFMRGKAIEGPPIKSVFNYGSPFCHAPAMVRTEAYKVVGGYTVDPKLLRMEDYNLWMKMYSAGYRGYNLSEHLYMMRDDRNAAKRRSFKVRKNEAYVKHLACKMLNLPFYYHIYCLKPLILGIMPTWLYRFIYKLR